MKVRVKFEVQDRTIDEVITVPDAEALLSVAKARLAKEMGWKGFFLNAMSPLQFGQAAVRLYNEKFGKSEPIPDSPDEFLKFGVAHGSLTILEP